MSDSEPEEKFLTARSKPLNLEANLNKTVVVSGVAGFHCPDCNVTLHDSVSYLDHVNGRQHLKNIGTSMMVERATLAQVKMRFEELKGKKHEQVEEYDLEKAVQKQRELEQKEKLKKKAEKAEKKRKRQEEQEKDIVADQEVAAIMGIGSFGSTKKR